MGLQGDSLAANFTLRLSKKDGREKLFDLSNEEFFERVKLKNAVILPYYK